MHIYLRIKLHLLPQHYILGLILSYWTISSLFLEYLISLMCAPILEVCPPVSIPGCIKWIWPFKKCTILSGSNIKWSRLCCTTALTSSLFTSFCNLSILFAMILYLTPAEIFNEGQKEIVIECKKLITCQWMWKMKIYKKLGSKEAVKKDDW